MSDDHPFWPEPDHVDSGWWAAQEEADARHEAEHGPARAGREPWQPAWVKLRDSITHGVDEKNCASSAESQEARY